MRRQVRSFQKEIYPAEAGGVAVFEHLEFSRPLFVLLAPFIVLISLLVSLGIARWLKRAVANFGERETLENFSRFSGRGKLRSMLYLSVALFLLSLAAADPQIPRTSEGKVRVLNAILVCDASKSMDAEDVLGGVSRYKLVSRALSQVIKSYQGLFGVVYFTDLSRAYGPSKERGDLLLLVDSVCDPSGALGSGSKIVKGLKAALAMTKDTPEPIKVILLLSDGGDPLEFEERLQIADALRGSGIKIITGGVGGLEYTQIPLRDPRTKLVTGYYSGPDGKPAQTNLEDEDLKYLAAITGGSYWRIEKGDELVEAARPLSQEAYQIDGTRKESLAWLPVSVLLLILLVWLLDKRFMR